MSVLEDADKHCLLAMEYAVLTADLLAARASRVLLQEVKVSRAVQY